MNIEFSELGNLIKGDFVRGLFVAIATVPLSIIYSTVSAGQLTFDWHSIVIAAILGGCGYLMKNLATGSGGKVFTNKP